MNPAPVQPAPTAPGTAAPGQTDIPCAFYAPIWLGCFVVLVWFFQRFWRPPPSDPGDDA